MFVSYCQYYLQGDDFLTVYNDADTVGRIFEGNSLAAAGPEHLTVFAGTHTGWIRLTTEQCAEEPPPPGLEEQCSRPVVGARVAREGRTFPSDRLKVTE